MLFSRSLALPNTPEKSFFLWGPRQVGKSTLLKQIYPDALRIDLLRGEQFLRFTQEPGYLRRLVAENPSRLVLIDEVQKIPSLLDEVHSLIEDLGARFVLCGSSARQLKRRGTNLLGGRARRYELHGLIARELGDAFDLERVLNVGNIPSHYLSDDPQSDLEAYVGDYLKEEIAAEALVQNLPAFTDFLRVAAITDTEIVDFTKVASECGVKMATAKNHYSVLVDTLLGFFLPAYVTRQKRRVIHSPKFYFSNVGVVNQLALRFQLKPGSELFGKAFENWLVNEVRTFVAYQRKQWQLTYWRLSSGGEVDLVINDCEHAFEFKSSSRLVDAHLKGLRALREHNPEIKSLTLINLEERPSRTKDGIQILPARLFLERLWGGEWS